MAGINNAVNNSKKGWFDTSLEYIGKIGQQGLSIFGGYHEIKTAREIEKEKKAYNMANSDLEIANKIQENNFRNYSNIIVVGILGITLLLVFRKIIK